MKTHPLKSFARIVQYDLRQGIGSRIVWYIPVILLACLSAMVTAKQASIFFTYNGLSGTPSFADFLIVFAKGSLPYSPAAQIPFELPAFWMTNLIYILFLTCYYPLQGLMGYGSLVLIKTTRRAYWWRSKCLYIFCSVMLCFALQYSVLLLFALKSPALFLPTPILLTEVFHVPPSIFSDASYLLYAVLLPILLASALSLWQMVLSLVLNATYSFIFGVLYLGASAYLFTPFLLGSAAMLLRSRLSIPNGVPFAPAAGILCVLCIVALMVGERLFRRYNILQK